MNFCTRVCELNLGEKCVIPKGNAIGIDVCANGLHCQPTKKLGNFGTCEKIMVTKKIPSFFYQNFQDTIEELDEYWDELDAFY